MKILISILSVIALIYIARGDDAWTVCAFKVEAVSEKISDEQIVRKIKLILVQNIIGATHETFDLTVTGKVEHPELEANWMPSNSRWLYGSLAGETVIVTYGKSIENPEDIIIGKDYVNDVAFVVTFPKELDVVARKKRIDQYLKTHHKVVFPRVADYIAQLVLDLGYSEEVWHSYVKGNPLGLKDAVHARLFDGLSVMMYDETDENGNSLIPAPIRKPRINLWLSEYATQLAVNAYSDANVKKNGIRFFAKMYKKYASFVTPETQAELDKLLSSDSLSTEQKKLFK